MDYRNAFDLGGFVAVITGGSRGIGFESAAALGACGAKTILAARDKDVLAAAISRLAKAGVDAAAVALDVTEPTAVTKAADAIVRSTARSTSSSTAPASLGSIPRSIRRTRSGARSWTSTSTAHSGVAGPSGVT
jgi:NAD(P)-dependent dehydrogenase (short-subunit alcohol dehydrogenase family)